MGRAGAEYLLIGLLAAGCSSPTPTSVDAPTPLAATGDETRPDDWFRDVTAASGLQFTPQTGSAAQRFTILETLGGGVAVVDIERDGDWDLLCAAGGQIDAATGAVTGVRPGLFVNDGSGHFFDASDRLTADTWNYSHGWAVGDYDRDGDDDVVLLGFGSSRLLRNEPGRHFVDVTSAAGLQGGLWETSGVFVDANGDGWLDLYIAAYVDFDPQTSQPCGTGPAAPDVCPPQQFAPQQDRLWLNAGDGTFVAATEEAGLLPDGRGLGVLAADFNADGRADVYVANDGEPNHLYLGGDEFPWREAGVATGVAVNEAGAAEGSMGLAWDDFDGNRLPDLFVTNFELEDNSLYEGLGNGLFRHATTRRGLGGQGRLNVGFGTASMDVDQDNRPDLVVLNGHVIYHSVRSPFLQSAAIYRNDAGQRFHDETPRGGPYFRSWHCGRGIAVADFNGDGGPDLVVMDLVEPVRLLQGAQPPEHWLRVALVPKVGDPTGIGARASVRIGTRRVDWFPQRGAGYASHGPCEWLCALPAAEPVEVEVVWASQRRETFGPLTPGMIHPLQEGEGHVSAPATTP